MPLTDLPTLPTAPLRSQPADEFTDNAEAWVSAIDGWTTAVNTLTAELEATAALIAVAPAYADVALKTIADSTLTPAANKAILYTGVSTAALIDISTVGQTLLAQTSQANMRTTGLGMSANGSSLVSAADYSVMRTLLGLVIGTNVQAYDAELAAIAGLVSAANKIPRFTGSGTADLIDFLDEDTMSSDSATAVPSQQSVKAYVDASAPALTSSGTATSGYMDIPTTGLGTIRVNWGRTTVGANTSTTATLAASYTTALIGSGQAMTTSTSDSDSSYCYLSSTTQMTVTNGTDGSLTFQWWAIGVV